MENLGKGISSPLMRGRRYTPWQWSCWLYNLLARVYYIPRRKSGIYWIQVRRAAAAAAVEISLWTR